MSEVLLEKSLVVKAQEGDEEAFEQLINISLVKLRGMLVGQYRLQPADLDEVIQVATMKVFKRISSFRNESSFTTWFYVVLKNEALDYVKKRKYINSHETSAHFTENENEDYQVVSSEETLEETAASMLEKKETLAIYRKMIEQVLDELTPYHRDVIKLSLDEEKSYKEIAEELKVPIGTVMSRLFFARKNAQSLIIEYAKRNSVQLDCLGES